MKTSEQTMNEFKSYASRALNDSGFEDASRKRWSRHGSTRHLFDEASLEAAIRYTLDGQGRTMSVYPSPATNGNDSSVKEEEDALPCGHGSHSKRDNTL